MQCIIDSILLHHLPCFFFFCSVSKGVLRLISVISIYFKDLFCPSFPNNFNLFAYILFSNSPLDYPPHIILKVT